MATTETVELIPRAQLRESPANVRRTFNAGKLKELADSIAAQGIIEPLVVRLRIVIDATPHYEIVAGARRFRAADLAGFGDLPCIVRELSDAQVAQLQTVENLQREGLTPLEEAAGYEQLHQLGAKDAAEIGALVGKSASYVWQRLRLLRLHPKVAQLVAAGTLSPSQAILLAPLEGKAQVELAGELQQNERHSVEDTELAIASYFRHLTGAPWKLDDAVLVKKAGPCTSCRFNSANAPESDQRRKPTCASPGCWDLKLKTWEAANRHVTAGKAAPARDPADRRRQQQRLAKARATHEKHQQRLAWAAAVAKRVGDTPYWLVPATVRLVAQALLEESHHEAHVAVCRMRGLEPAQGKRAGFNYAAAVKKAIAGAKPGQPLVTLLFQLVLAPAVEGGYWTSKRLEPLAARYKVTPPKLAPARKRGTK